MHSAWPPAERNRLASGRMGLNASRVLLRVIDCDANLRWGGAALSFY